MTALNGKWIYRSFRPNDGKPPLAPWAPHGRLSVMTDGTGRVDGVLTFPSVPGLEFTVSGSITPAVGQLPAGVELTGESGGHSSINKLVGYFITDTQEPLIVGNITAVRNDPARQPDGTVGLFVLFACAADV
jgi:hypothetical protein